MRNLIEFFLRYSSWMLFVAYMAAGCFMLFTAIRGSTM